MSEIRRSTQEVIQTLQPGNYSFRHDFYGQVEFRFGLNPETSLHEIKIYGTRTEAIQGDERRTLVTADAGVEGVSSEDAFRALRSNSPRMWALIENFAIERQLDNSKNVFVMGRRSDLSLEQRRIMRNTGRIPIERRVWKTDSF